MNTDMKNREIFSRLITTYPFVIRLDGRSFHTFSSGYKKPFDEILSQFFIKTAKTLFTDSGFSPDFCYTFSDEISMLIQKPVYDMRVEKLVSVSSAFTASAFTVFSKSEKPIAFDARVIPLSASQFPAYLAWRQAEAWRNHINGYCQKILIDDGLSVSEVQKKLDGLNASALHELAFEHGINLSQTPAWQRRGIAVYCGSVEKERYNSMTRKSSLVKRNIAMIDQDLPLFKTDTGFRWVMSKMNSPQIY